MLFISQTLIIRIPDWVGCSLIFHIVFKSWLFVVVGRWMVPTRWLWVILFLHFRFYDPFWIQAESVRSVNWSLKVFLYWVIEFNKRRRLHPPSLSSCILLMLSSHKMSDHAIIFYQTEICWLALPLAALISKEDINPSDSSFQFNQMQVFPGLVR